MPRATVVTVMVATPGDLEAEKARVCRTLEAWNAANTRARGLILRAVRSETGTAPDLSERAQAVVNRQLGLCDILVGMFRSRVGTPTGVATSGTVEEIERHVAAGRKVMLYFADEPALVPDTADVNAVRQLKADYQRRGLYETFCNADQLEAKLRHQLDIHLNALYPPARSTIDGQPLGAKAMELLKVAVQDRLGRLQRLNVGGRKILRTNGREFIANSEPREVAAWEAAVSELVQGELLRPVGHRQQVFEVTAEGFQRSMIP